MSSWDTLPTEIITKIANEIESRQDVKQFQLTCKGWAPLAQQQLYTDIKLSSKFQLQVFTESITANPSLGLLVERLDISTAFFQFSRERCTPLEYLTIFIERCPNVRQILNTDGFYIEVWRLLINALHEGKWKQLHLIEPSSGNVSVADHEQAIWEIRGRLTELRMTDDVLQIAEDSGENKGPSIAKKILAFPKLQDLTLIIKKRRMHIFDFNEHIDNCVSLKKLTVHCFLLCSDPVKDLQCMERRVVSDISSIKQQYDVKQLQATISYFHDDSLIYIMRKFPSLSILMLCCNGYTNKPLSYEVCRQFLEYVSKIQLVNIYQLRMKNVVCELLLNTFFKDIIKSDKRKTRFIISYNRYNREPGQSVLSIETEPSYRNLTSHLDVFTRFWYRKICGSSTISVFFCSATHYDGSSLPHVSLLENLGYEMTALKLDCQTDDSVFTNIEEGYFLDHILENCPRLEDLAISYASLAHCNSTLPIANRLDTLSLHGCNIYSDFFNSLSPLLPSLESLYLEGCSFFNSQDSQCLLKKPYLLVNMPHTSIRSLYVSIYDGEYLSLYKYNSFCVRVNVHGKKEMYFAITNLEYFPVFLTGSQAKPYYQLDDNCCFVMDLECFNVNVLYVMFASSSNIYGIDWIKNEIVHCRKRSMLTSEFHTKARRA
jgi:hypothetical protein